MSEEVAHKVKLHAYDLSRGMARAMSQQLLGIQLDGIWYDISSSIVLYRKRHNQSVSLD